VVLSVMSIQGNQDESSPRFVEGRRSTQSRHARRSLLGASRRRFRANNDDGITIYNPGERKSRHRMAEDRRSGGLSAGAGSEARVHG